VIPAHFEWDDLGTWNAWPACAFLMPPATWPSAGGCSGYRGCIIYNTEDQLIATLGVRDLVIVQARGKVLVCHKDKAPLLKEIMPCSEKTSGEWTGRRVATATKIVDIFC